MLLHTTIKKREKSAERKIIKIRAVANILSAFCICIILFAFFALPCSAASVSTGTINSTALNYFEGVVKKLPAGTDYILYKSGDYTTDLVYSSDLQLSDNTVSGTDLTCLRYNTRSYTSGNNYTSTYTEYHYQTFDLTTDDFSICYSSLGNWSDISDNSNTTLNYILYAVIFILFIIVAFKFIRHRRSYIDL